MDNETQSICSAVSQNERSEATNINKGSEASTVITIVNKNSELTIVNNKKHKRNDSQS
ncbi:9627_t:CDS:2 [Cetraspora pellucida]|uniref:9627_t:CDS:1 n=1 Tax=Cetraspora pellucida TaxID=1433469 RepID=A0A9N9A9Z1_9GLOM|nr:9627_t:CDS:2 [Cetraspora pellucida]